VQQMENSDLDLVVAGSRDSVLMIEGFAEQYPEEDMVEAIMFAHQSVVALCDLQEEFAKQVGAPEYEYVPPEANPFDSRLRDESYDTLRAAKSNSQKQERHRGTDELKTALLTDWFPDDADENDQGTRAQFKEAFHTLEARVIRDLILDGTRLDGRKPDDLRDVACRTQVLPRVHGSAVFTRGETQSLATVTLGTVRDQQRADGLFGEMSSRFMLHYYFPSYSVGEVRPIRG
ncbi:MAG: polyribonucleotide nucleotidyltransferase, partial [Planctomycetaceae bacterium]